VSGATKTVEIKGTVEYFAKIWASSCRVEWF